MKEDFHKYLEEIGEIGFVERVISPALLYLKGLPGVKPEEVVVLESGEIGQVRAVEETLVELLCFSRDPVAVGTRAVRTNHQVLIHVGEELLGSIIDPLGRSIVPSRPLPELKEVRPIEVLPPGIGLRARIKRPCDTGITMVDLMLPLGQGQRELVIGDPKSGKSLALMRILLSQITQGSLGVYAVIGKSKIAIHQVAETLERMGILRKVVVVASSADDAAGMMYLAPYTAMSIAEYFRDRGRDVLVVLDDLTVHAKAHREISLLSRRFPGRSAYPGDMFYTHARLLERAGNFKVGAGECAITCLPVVEATQGDITGYIQTNAMSMTDGHLFFDHRLFAEGRRPAINPFLSVTRVGRQTQSPLKREIGRLLLSFLSEAQKMHLFASFGAELSEHVRSALEKEGRLMTLFDQTIYDTVPPTVQVVLFGFIWGNLLEEKSREALRLFIQRVIWRYAANAFIRERMDEIVTGSNSVDILIDRIRESGIAETILISGHS